MKTYMANAINHHLTHDEIEEIGGLISLGGRRLIKFPATTELRNLKRLTLLMVYLLQYRTMDEVEQIRQRVIDNDKHQAKVLAGAVFARAMQLVRQRGVWARDITSRYGGRLVHYHRQGDDPRLAPMDITERGWCLGMSTEWLIDKRSFADFWAGHGTPDYARRFRMVMAGQALRAHGLEGANLGDLASYRLKRVGMDRAMRVLLTGNPSCASLARSIVNTPGEFLLVLMSLQGGEGHAIACRKHAGGITLMDPNLGEVHFQDPGRFQTWFRLLCRFKDYHLRNYDIETYRPARHPDRWLAAQMRARRRDLEPAD
ncbi:MAG: YopT-type cysteine protease domain-containing protein [Pseudomonadota bacterium]